jgi:PAS domain S-box-containing protein
LPDVVLRRLYLASANDYYFFIMQPSETSYTTLEGNGSGEDRFRELVDHAPFLLWMTDCDGSFTFFNRPWLEFRGRTMAEELGRGWLEGMHPEDARRYTDTYQRAFERRQNFQVEYRLRRADGEYRWIAAVGVPQFTKDGRFLGYLGSCVEIRAPHRSNGHPALTARELQVLKLVADGKSTKEVAATLNISYKTADSHRSRVMEKLDVHETASLVRNAIRRGLIEA